jgi:hypothetical protein
MATTTRFSVAKTERSYSPEGVAAVLGSTVKSETEAVDRWGGLSTFQIYNSTNTN